MFHHVLSSIFVYFGDILVIFGCILVLFSVASRADTCLIDLIDVRLEPAGNARTEGYGRVVHVWMVVVKS